jgi:hypothetical protein
MTMNKLIIGAMLCLFASISFAEGCWTAKEKSEIEGFSELDGKLILSLKDAVNCQPIANASVVVEGNTYQSDYAGNVELTGVGFDFMSENMDMVISQQKYATYKGKLRFEAGTVIKRRFLLSKKMDVGNWRFVLTWAKSPKDLDLHLKSNDFHVSYRNKKGSSVAKLDRDALNGFGPETISLTKTKTKIEQKYMLYVNNFSARDFYNSYASVDVYQGSSLMHSLRLPNTSKRNVLVGEIINHQFVPSVRPFNP